MNRPDPSDPSAETSSLQQELQALRQELREKNRVIKRQEEELKNFLYTLSHEIKTPIGAIRGFATLILEEYNGQVPPEVLDYLNRICKNVDNLEALLNDLNLLSRLNIDEDSFEEININDLVSDIILGLYGQFVFDKSFFQVQPRLPVAYGYREGLRHVFTNLITNALKYCKERVEPRIEIGCLEDEFFLKYFVKDNGIGIPASAQKKIFDMFVRVKRKKKARGTGLGLYLVRRIIQAHGGEVWVQSKPGKGATFYFTLPKPPASRAESKIARE